MTDNMKLPQLVSNNDKAYIIVEVVKQIQAELFRLEVTQTTNGHRYTDVVPGSQSSYDDQRNFLNASLNRIQVCYPEYVDIIGSSARGV